MRFPRLGEPKRVQELRRYERFLANRIGHRVASVTVGDDRERTVVINAYKVSHEERTIVVATIGLSQVAHGPAGPVELILLVNDEIPAAIDAVNGVVSLVADHPEALVLGSVFRGHGTMGVIASRYMKPAMVLTTAESVWPSIAHAETGGDPIHLLALIAVTAREADLADDLGVIELERRLTAAATVDVSDLSRPSAV